MLPAVKGLLLGVANTVVIATANAIAAATNTEIGWGRMTRGHMPDPLELFTMITMLGLFPAMFTGLFVGWIAGLLRLRPAWRLAILSLPAVGLVAFLGAATGSLHLIAVSCIPTLAATSILERWTRAPALVPSARTT
jgi:hypothetical protein